ncbi:hypothetical protein C8R45DRAFT_1125057 [Mycena sanguinolenta]|nr:hypothetical protein C8R45DRAFT_1125057 [Mycena sanguinolenta]
MRWLLPTVCLCGIGELVGWSGRLWSSFSPALSDPYMMQNDIIALFVQSGGGGIAASSHKISSQNLGGIMLGGIIFQFIALCVYVASGADFLRNYLSFTPVRPMISAKQRGTLDSRLKIMLGARRNQLLHACAVHPFNLSHGRARGRMDWKNHHHTGVFQHL